MSEFENFQTSKNQPVRRPVVLQTNMASHGDDLQIVLRQALVGFIIQIDVLYLYSVNRYSKVMSFAGYNHMIPFSGLFRNVAHRLSEPYDSSMVMVCHDLVFFPETVEYLHLDACFYWIFCVAHPKEETTVSFWWIFVFHFKNEIRIFFF